MTSVRQKIVWSHQDLRIPPTLISAIKSLEEEKIEAILSDKPALVWAENLIHLVCRIPGYEGHGGFIPLDIRDEKTRCRIIDDFVRRGINLNIRNRRKVTPLHMACRYGLDGIARHLLHLGVDPDPYDVSRETPLFRAVNLGHVACVEALIEFGADVNFINRKRQAPLHRAAIRGKRRIVPLLVAAGANRLAVDKFGKRPLDYARNRDIKSVLDQDL